MICLIAHQSVAAGAGTSCLHTYKGCKGQCTCQIVLGRDGGTIAEGQAFVDLHRIGCRAILILCLGVALHGSIIPHKISILCHFHGAVADGQTSDILVGSAHRTGSPAGKTEITCQVSDVTHDNLVLKCAF